MSDPTHPRADLEAITARLERGLDERWGPADVRELVDELTWLRRAGETLGRVVAQQGQWVLEATGMHDAIGEDGDGDWAAVWERLSELRTRSHVGRCGALSPAVEPYTRFCSLPHGHASWHRGEDGSEWSPPHGAARLTSRERSAIRVVLRFLDATEALAAEQVRDAIVVVRELAGAIGADLEWHAIDKLLVTPHPARGDA